MESEIINPISNTAFYTCGLRMQDAEKTNSVCQDNYAKYFMDERGLAIFENFTSEKKPNASNLTRHRIIDDCLRHELRNNPNIQIIIIGAGFDSRAYRLEGGNWLELDEPQVIAYKNERLPIEKCKNNLQRIAINFETEMLEDKLKDFSSNKPVFIIFEGVFIYLPEAVIKQKLKTLQNLFTKHKLICDLMTDKFFEKHGSTLHQKLQELGASFKYTPKHPQLVFLDTNYKLFEKISIISKAIEFGIIDVPIKLGSVKMHSFFFRTFLKILATGYMVYIFETGD